MADQMKHIVSALNAPPFNRNYNLISFDALAPNRLLQELSDVLAYVNGDATPIDVRLETPDQTALRILNLLRILKYKPPSDPDEL
jgi:intraflagellar transport protein 81